MSYFLSYMPQNVIFPVIYVPKCHISCHIHAPLCHISCHIHHSIIFLVIYAPIMSYSLPFIHHCLTFPVNLPRFACRPARDEPLPSSRELKWPRPRFLESWVSREGLPASRPPLNLSKDNLRANDGVRKQPRAIIINAK